MAEPMDDNVTTEVGVQPLVQCIGGWVGIAAGVVSVPLEDKLFVYLPLAGRFHKL